MLDLLLWGAVRAPDIAPPSLRLRSRPGCRVYSPPSTPVDHLRLSCARGYWCPRYPAELCALQRGGAGWGGRVTCVFSCGGASVGRIIRVSGVTPAPRCL